MTTEDSKTCSKCGETKPLSEYYRAADCIGGVRPNCKVCRRAEEAARRKADPEAASAKEKARYARHREKRKAEARAWAAKNRERRKIVQKAYYDANRDRYAQWAAKRKAIKRSVEHQPYTRREIYDRDNGHCKLCRTPLPYEPNGFHLDHIVPLSLGGPDTPANLQLTCQPCNRAKWANLEGQIALPV